MVKVLTKHNTVDYVKKDMVAHYLAIGYIIAVL
jgi:hypothetical protein